MLPSQPVPDDVPEQPTFEDLTPWQRRKFEQAYDHRERYLPEQEDPDPSPQQVGGAAPVALALDQLVDARDGSFHWSGRSGERQSVNNRGAVRLNAVREADERAELAGGCVLQPVIEVTHTPPCDQSTESLQQLIPRGETFVVIQNFLERITLVLIELIRRTQTQPPDVDAFDSWPGRDDDRGQVLAVDADPATAQVPA